MRTLVLAILLFVLSFSLAGCGGGGLGPITKTDTASPVVAASPSAAGPQESWMVVTLPNPAVTPLWQSYAPDDCRPDPSACAQDHRFWEEWDFSEFRGAIDGSFKAISKQGKYQGVMLLMPLADSPMFWRNVKLMFDSANAQGLRFQTVVFPKNKYGSEQCYLYPSNAPASCATVPVTGTAIAYESLLKLMNFVENLGGGCSGGSSKRPVAVWYGWSQLPGYDTLSRFWHSLPTNGCNLRASYVTWLDTMYSTAPEVGQMQKYVTDTLKQKYWVNTELYGLDQIEANYSRYAPYQTVITGYFGASEASSWAKGMCDKWNLAGHPAGLGVWNFSDRDVAPVEQYRALIHDAMAHVGKICDGSS